MERPTGNDPASSLWQREILPLNYGRNILERVGEVESHSAQLGRLATHLELTRFVMAHPRGNAPRPPGLQSGVRNLLHKRWIIYWS